MEGTLGEDDARDLFAALYPQLAGWAARLTDPETGRDIAGEAFTRLLQNWRSVNDPKPWLYMTAGNLVKDLWRSAGRERKAMVRLRPVDDLAASPDTADRSAVRALVEQLPDRLRLVVLLHYYADLSVAQVAATTDKAEGTVKRDLFDARALMARSLKEAS